MTVDLPKLSTVVSAREARGERRASRGALTAALAVGIFAVDVLTSLEGAVAVLYVVVVLQAARPFGRLGVALTGASCLCLTAMAYVVSHGSAPIGSPLLRCAVSLVAVGVTTMLVRANLRNTTALAEKAGLVELTHDSVFVRDPHDVIIFWNRAAEELYGWRRAEVLGRVAHELLSTVFPAGREAAMAALLATGRWEGELVHTARSGRTVVVESSWALRRDGEGRPVCVLETNTDITERKRSQEALLALQAELAYAARKATLGELTASIAHEVNQPLAAIVTSGQAALRWLGRDRPDLPEASDAIRRVVANGARAAEIVAGIRSFLTNAPRREPILLPAMIDEAAALIEREIARHGVALIREVEPGLPPVVGDRVQLQQVMINLMVNAVQAMEAVAQPRRVLRVRVAREDGGVLIAVADGGEGFASEHAERMFDAFFTTKADGMGMGLSICRSIIEAHGGHIRVSRPEGPGAVFQVRLPSAPAPAA